MSNKKKYWVVTTRIKINEIEQTFEYGAEFPELEDERRIKRLLDAGMLSTAKPTDIPEPQILEVNHFIPSEPYEDLPEKVVGKSKKKKEEDN
ncbi:hypothetical protein LCGC14_3146160 [marine sediment metagenome]|uniref:Uncharacterized protein n=1 Tax=marine sediment metagenome TaxID=412755 RepID=A0A0F8WJF2_9ZZZZ